MSIRDVVTAGFGSWESNVAFIPTRGFGNYAVSAHHGAPIPVGPPYLAPDRNSPWNARPHLPEFSDVERRIMLLAALGVYRGRRRLRRK